ncbi:MAG TPA: type III-B CRISPR module-associated protein Cmr3 [Bryobacteraceae bacterium]|nr:type III-B CRISPR module-associated protein Cmr3 [Bryobacteraceae bacterium]
MTYLRLTPRDPVVARDGRPFGAGSGRRMKSLDWLLPSVVAGSFRTMHGKMDARGFNADAVAELKQIAIAGPLPVWKSSLFLPAPKDFALQSEPRECFRIRPRPLKTGDYCDLPHGKLRPALLPEFVTDEFKPEPPPAFWSMAKMTAWLMEGDFPPPPEKNADQGRDPETGFLDSLPKDERTHVQIEADTGAATEHMLYSTVSLAFHEGVAISLRVSGANHIEKLDALHPVGGERRLVRWETDEDVSWECLPALAGALAGAERIRMVLATPAIFGGGWKPGWLDDNLEGTPPGTGVKLRLTGVAMDRWRAVSGFGLEDGLLGPKPVRRMVPAGSVYFFEYISGDRTTLSTGGWLAPVSDLAADGQDRRDGFGLTLWGVWNE